MPSSRVYVGEWVTVVVLQRCPDLSGSQAILRATRGQLWRLEPHRTAQPWRKGVLTIGKPGYLKLQWGIVF